MITADPFIWIFLIVTWSWHFLGLRLLILAVGNLGQEHRTLILHIEIFRLGHFSRFVLPWSRIILSWKVIFSGFRGLEDLPGDFSSGKICIPHFLLHCVLVGVVEGGADSVLA